MRRAALAFGPFTLLAGAIFACESDPNGGGGPSFELDSSAPSFDGGQQPFDSSTTPEASPDAPSGPRTVTVTVTGRTGPVANVRVVFNDAAGAVLETKLTDASGKAKSTGALPAMATALFAKGWQHELVTWTGLEDGDELTVREPDPDLELGQYDVTLPGPFDNTDLMRYSAYAGGCYGSVDGTSSIIDLYSGCAGGDKTSVLVWAIDPDNQIAGHSFKKGNAIPASGVTTALTTSAWTAPTSVTVTATNTPADQQLEVNLLEIADGHGYEDGYSHWLENGSTVFKTATGFADALQSTIAWYGGFGSRLAITKRLAPGPSITFDASEALPPITGGEIVEGSGPRRPVIQWTSPSTAAADGGLVRMQLWDQEDNRYAWTFVVPPGSTKVTAPAMPPEAGEFLPDVDADRDWVYPTIGFLEADSIQGYKAFRAMQGTLAPAGNSLTYNLPALPTNGTYRMTSWELAL